jgi:hypothetical protein
MEKQKKLRGRLPDQRILQPLADWLAVAVAVSLPWSTSATGILVVLWLFAALPTLDLAAVRRALASAAGGLPVLLAALAAVGMLWADVSWSDRLSGLSPFHRFLFIPLLLALFRRSEHGARLLWGFFASVAVLLVFSWALVFFPKIPWRTLSFGVPVKDYILQSDEFLICAFVLLEAAIVRGCAGRWRTAALFVALALAFLTNIAFVATGRTTLLVAPVLILLLGWRHFRWKGLVGAVLLFSLVGGPAAFESPYLRMRLSNSVVEFEAWRKNDAVNATALHLQFLEEALSFVAAAPFVGHGTGSIAAQYRKEAFGETGAAGVASVNPHNQILAVAIQLGLLGAAVLIAMWGAHFMLFRGSGLLDWIGIIIVTDNVVSSLVNSHLFDFTQAWFYVFGVGVAGGMALRRRDAEQVSLPALSHEPSPITA